MSSSILVDTDILIDVARGITQAISCLELLKLKTGLAISVVTQMELMVGCKNKSELQILEKFLQQFEIMRIDPSVSDQTVKLLRHYPLSHGLLIPDGLIAATALVYEAPFITKNQRDYHFIENLNLLPYPSTQT